MCFVKLLLIIEQWFTFKIYDNSIKHIIYKKSFYIYTKSKYVRTTPNLGKKYILTLVECSFYTAYFQIYLSTYRSDSAAQPQNIVSIIFYWCSKYENQKWALQLIHSSMKHNIKQIKKWSLFVSWQMFNQYMIII